MSTTKPPAVLMWVAEIGTKPSRSQPIIFGHDFRPDFGWVGASDHPTGLVAWRDGQPTAIRGAHVAHVHRFGDGWEWEVDKPELMPEPPFLLTDDQACKLLFRGEVLLRPNPHKELDIASWISEYGELSLPMLGENWFGVVRVDDSGLVRGNLEAFARERIEPLRGEVPVSAVDEGEMPEPFGYLVIS